MASYVLLQGGRPRMLRNARTICRCRANACLSRRSATKPDLPRDRLWESMGEYGKRAKPAAAG